MNIELLLAPLSEASPAGEDCGHTYEFQQVSTLAEYLVARAVQEELERQAKAQFDGENAESEQRSASAFAADGRRRIEGLAAAIKEFTGRNASVEAAQKEIVSRGEALLKGTGKDIRVAQVLALAWLGQSGLAGLKAGFELTEALIERFQATVHPMPDEDDPSDQTGRAMVVSEMISGSGFWSVLRESVVLDAPGIGRLTARDLEAIDGQDGEPQGDAGQSSRYVSAIAAGIAASEAGLAPSAVTADAVKKVLDRQAMLTSECMAAANRLSARFEPGTLRGGDRVIKLLQKMVAQLEEAAAENAGSGDSVPNSGSTGGPAQPEGSGIGRLQTREDARRAILEVCRFIQRIEPSHPAPLFLQRAERLLGAKDFFAIVRDIAPDAMSELEKITGHRQEGETAA